MRNLNKAILLLALAAGLSSCNTARVDGYVKNTPASGRLAVKTISGTGLKVLDSVAVKDGKFVFETKIKKNQPEFFYIFNDDDVMMASLLLSPSDKVTLRCIVPGFWEVEGSEDCELLRNNESAFTRFVNKKEITAREYIEYYRQSTKYIMQHSHSLTVIPELFRKIGDVELYARSTDGVIFSAIADSLSTVYPQSRYVRMLRAEADKKTGRMKLESMLNAAGDTDFPELNYPAMDGKNVTLSSVVKGKTLLVFWDATRPTDKIFNIDVLKPLYESVKGLDIYQVNVGTDKNNWAMVMREQKLPWTNVCDVRGNSLLLFGVTRIPDVVLLEPGKAPEHLNSIQLSDLRSRLR